MAHDPTANTGAILPHPALKAILLCERIIRDVNGRQATLVGLVDDIAAPEFPFVYVRGLELYVRVADAAGEYEARMEIVRMEDDRTIVAGNARIAMDDRTRAYEVTFEIARVLFERPGRYDFRFSVNGRFVATAVLLLTEVA